MKPDLHLPESLAPRKTFKNPHRVSWKDIVADSGMTEDEALTHWTLDSVVPACCDEGCEVEPDGTCEHGCPSVLMAAGLV